MDIIPQIAFDRTAIILIGVGEYSDNSFTPIPGMDDRLKNLTAAFCTAMPYLSDLNAIEVNYNSKRPDEINELIKDLCKGKDLDLLLIYYCGNGLPYSDVFGLEEELLLTFGESSQTEKRINHERSIRVSRLLNQLTRYKPSAHKLLILDCSFSWLAKRSLELSKSTNTYLIHTARNVKEEGIGILTSLLELNLQRPVFSGSRLIKIRDLIEYNDKDQSKYAGIKLWGKNPNLIIGKRYSSWEILSKRYEPAIHRKIDRESQLMALSEFCLQTNEIDKVKFVVTIGREEDFVESLIDNFVDEKYDKRVNWILNDSSFPTLEMIKIGKEIQDYDTIVKWTITHFYSGGDQILRNGSDILRLYKNTLPLIFGLKVISWKAHTLEIIKKLVNEFWGNLSTNGRDVFVFICIVPSQSFNDNKGNPLKSIYAEVQQKKLKKFLRNLKRANSNNLKVLPKLENIPKNEVRDFFIQKSNISPFLKNAFIEYLDQLKTHEVSMKEIEREVYLQFNLT